MSEELLPYYNQELTFLRHLAAEFAAEHPKIAGRLKLASDGSQDPHVERLLQGAAYLSARIRLKLDDDFPELSDAMLGVLYPHFQAPIPSMSVVQFHLDRSQGELTTGYGIPMGTTIETEPVDGEPCRYRTTYPATLWPIQLDSARLAPRPIEAPQTRYSSQAMAVLKLELSTYSKTVAFKQFQIERLRFYLHNPQPQVVFALYEMLFTRTLEIAVAKSPDDPRPMVLPKSSLAGVGFKSDEGMFPYSARSFVGYRLLSEFFAFPEKFLFVDLVLPPGALRRLGNKAEIYFYLEQTSAELEKGVGRDTLRLGCAPMVNLFTQRAEPFIVTGTDSQYRVVPDSRREHALELYSIDRVSATGPEGEEATYLPFYSFQHAVDRSSQRTFWHATKQPSAQTTGGLRGDPGQETFVTLVDLDFSPAAPPNWTVDIETTCFNRDLPRHLPFSRGRPILSLPELRGPISEVLCVTPPTPTLRPPIKRMALWQLVSQLSLNHLSLTETSGDAAEALREILRLYDMVNSASTQSLISGLVNLRSKRVVGRAGGVAGGFCRGTEITLHLDEKKFIGSGAYLFSAVLDRFLGLYVSVNSFTRLVVTTEQRKGQGELWKWPPRAGEKILV